MKSDPFPIFFWEEKTRHPCAFCRLKKPGARESIQSGHIYPLSSLDFHSTPQFELIFQCLGLAGRFSVSIRGVKEDDNPQVPRSAQKSLGKPGGGSETAAETMSRDSCATVQPYLLLFSNHPTGLLFSPLSPFLLLRFMGRKGPSCV